MTPGNSSASFDTSCNKVYLNGYLVARIAYALIKNYMTSNAPSDCGVQLAQRYDPDVTKSTIFLDMGYNFKAATAGKVPAVFVQRGEVSLKNQTLGTFTSVEDPTGTERRRVISQMPLIVSCVAAEPLPVVENLAEYVKQPLLYFRKEVETGFSIRRFMVDRITQPQLDGSGKSNFRVDIMLSTAFDEGWEVTRESMKFRRLGVNFFDELQQPIQSFLV